MLSVSLPIGQNEQSGYAIESPQDRVPFINIRVSLATQNTAIQIIYDDEI